MEAVLSPHSVSDDRSSIEMTRSVFISDTHLGCSHAKARQLLEFLSAIKPRYLYIVGDFIDGWELRKRWKWVPEFTDVLKYLARLSHQGCTVRYAIGNHDDFLRQDSLLTELIRFGDVEIAEEFEHVTQDGRRFLVVHGDRFDEFSTSSAAFEWLTTVSYNALLTGNDIWHRWFGGRYGIVSGRVKSSMRTMAAHVSRFRSRLCEHAQTMGCDGVICGHVHAPEYSRQDAVEYVNTGDWLENCTAVIERPCGQLELRYHHATRRPSECLPDERPSSVVGPAISERVA